MSYCFVGLPGSVLPPIAGSYSDDSDGEFQSESYYQSSVEVHHTPQHSINGAATARLIITDETSSDSDDIPSEEPLGAIGGVENRGFQVVEDHFCTEDSGASSPSAISTISSSSSDSVVSGPAELTPLPQTQDAPEVTIVNNEEDSDEGNDSVVA